MKILAQEIENGIKKLNGCFALWHSILNKEYISYYKILLVILLCEMCIYIVSFENVYVGKKFEKHIENVPADIKS